MLHHCYEGIAAQRILTKELLFSINLFINALVYIKLTIMPLAQPKACIYWIYH